VPTEGTDPQDSLVSVAEWMLSQEPLLRGFNMFVIFNHRNGMMIPNDIHIFSDGWKLRSHQ
jgi:hypothetical protein